MTVDFIGSYLLKATPTPLPGEETYDCSGLFGPTCGSLFPSGATSSGCPTPRRGR